MDYSTSAGALVPPYPREQDEYRTSEQFHEILESAYNGNWTYAAHEVVKYGFYAQDLIIGIEESTLNELITTGDEYHLWALDALITLTEMAGRIRHQSPRCHERCHCLNCSAYQEGLPPYGVCDDCKSQQ